MVIRRTRATFLKWKYAGYDLKTTIITSRETYTNIYQSGLERLVFENEPGFFPRRNYAVYRVFQNPRFQNPFYNSATVLCARYVIVSAWCHTRYRMGKTKHFYLGLWYSILMQRPWYTPITQGYRSCFYIWDRFSWSYHNDDCVFQTMFIRAQSIMMTSSSSALLALCAGNSPVNSLHKGQWRGSLMFSLICARTNGWVNHRYAGDLRRHLGHYDVIVMIVTQCPMVICETCGVVLTAVSQHF